jgi:hypothetical protein
MLMRGASARPRRFQNECLETVFRAVKQTSRPIPRRNRRPCGKIIRNTLVINPTIIPQIVLQIPNGYASSKYSCPSADHSLGAVRPTKIT